jgi:cytochrome c-type biogenesis protein CcmF
VWGNHEGSMLLWILVLTIFNYFIYKLYNQKNFTFISKSLEIQAIITIGFLLFTIFTSNPFERMMPAHPNGLGFNPLLQDPALAIHPPLLYIGYVGFSAAFSFSIAAMSINTEEKISWYSLHETFCINCLDFLISWYCLWFYMGLLRIRLGRMVVLGSC